MRLRPMLFIHCFFLWFFPCLTCSGQDARPQENEEEALFLRRISEFWQEGEYQIAKNQIEEFIVQYPQSSFSDALSSALGDLLLREKNYSQALNYYSQVQSADYAEKIFLSRMQCLYQLQWYATLADECEAQLQKGDNLKDEQKLHTTYFLAIALYQQCLNAAKEPENLVKLAHRAQPYFETLFKTELSEEVAQSFAHLCFILKEFPKAAQIYNDLAQKDPLREEEMRFQAAVIQSEYDKELALRSFDEIAKKGQKKAKDAAFNRLVLTFDTGRYAELTSAKDALLSQMPEEKMELVRLFLGRSLLALKKFPEAVAELQAFVSKADESSESLHPALLSLLEASYQAGDLAALDGAIEKLIRFFPENSENPIELPKALFSRAQVLKQNQKIEEAAAELEGLLVRFPRFAQRSQALFELSHIHFQKKAWDSCHTWSQCFLTEFPHHELASFARRYLISSSLEIVSGKSDPLLKQQLVKDLETLLTANDESQKVCIPASERIEWEFLYAKTLIQLSSYPKAISLLKSRLNETGSLNEQQEANAWLLLAICYRDGLNDLIHFCEHAEMALSKNANLLQAAQIHIFLFNAYLERGQSDSSFFEKSADHLYAAFEAKSPIQPQNLLWMANFYFSQLPQAESNLLLSQKTEKILEHLLQPFDFQLTEKSLYLESAFCKLAKVYSILKKTDLEISLLENFLVQSQKYPRKSSGEKEAQLLLGEAYAVKGEKEKALALFDALSSSTSSARTMLGASASLQSARLKMDAASIRSVDSPDFIKAASQLKNLIIQKTLANEPSHLEAALDYIDLQTRFETNAKEKRLSLLLKMKTDFERTDDLLSKDYHEARTKMAYQDKVYQGYMKLFDAEILALKAESADPSTQIELHAKAKDLLLQIINEKTHPSLVQRARRGARG